MMRRLAWDAGVSRRTLSQVSSPLRKSTAAAGQDVAEAVDDRPADWNSAKPYSEIPGPKPLPIIGNVWRYLPGIGEYGRLSLSDFFKKIKEQYGPISRLTGLVGKPDVVVTSDPDYSAQVFRNEGAWPIRRGLESLTYYFTHLRKGYPLSLVASQGKEWQEFRTAVNQVMMQPRNTKQYVEPIDRVTQEFIDRMREIRTADNKMPENFQAEIFKWALESITYVALDARLGVIQNMDPNSEAAKMIECVHTVFDCTYQLDFLPSPWRYISTPSYRKFVRAMDYVTEISGKYVNLAMERLKNTPHVEGESRSYSVLENLLIKTENPEKAVTMALDMLLAGIDTTGGVVATVMYQLSAHPEKQKKLQEELVRVIPDPTKPLSKQQLEEMRYLRACIKESMRMMPLFQGNSRTTVKDMVIGGYQIPKGTMISMDNNSLKENEKYFPRGKEFLPERWLPDEESLKSKHPFAFLPFGFGPRMCVGRRFADLEIETIIAKTFRNFTLEWNLPPPVGTFHILFRFTDPLTFTVKDNV